MEVDTCDDDPIVIIEMHYSVPHFVPLHRSHTWEADLQRHLSERAVEPFQLGSRDCALFVCDAIHAMTGTDVAAEFRGKYTTALGAARRIKRVTGGSTVEHAAEYVTHKYGMPQLTTVLLAQRGDVVLYDGDEGPALGIVSLNGRDALFVTEQAMRAVPVSQCRAAWRV